MRFQNFYPWQITTNMFGLQLSCRLDSYDAKLLRKDLEAILNAYSLGPQHGVHHVGGWRAIGLISANGDPFEDRPLIGEPYLETPALEMAPYIKEILDSFECEKMRVRVSKLNPGKHIYWHCDNETIDGNWVGTARFHIPIVTNEETQFQISHENINWAPGEFWYGDFSFPHRVYNGGKESRIHLVIDLVIDDKVRHMFPKHVFEQAEKREDARKIIRAMFKVYHPIRYDIPRRYGQKFDRMKAWLASQFGARSH